MANPMDYMDTIRAIAYKMAWDSESFENTISEMYIAVLEENPEVEPALLLTRAKRNAIDSLRSKRYNYSYRDVIPHFRYGVLRDLRECHHPFQENPEEDIVNALTVQQLIELADDEDREPLLLWSEGYKQKEIGAQIGVTRSMVSVRLGRIVRKLKEKINNAD